LQDAISSCSGGKGSGQFFIKLLAGRFFLVLYLWTLHSETGGIVQVSADGKSKSSASTIPAPSVIVKHSMPNFIVIGKSGAVKTSLATRLAAELGCKFVSAATLSEIDMDDETNEVISF
jgi:hypothetical protein